MVYVVKFKLNDVIPSLHFYYRNFLTTTNDSAPTEHFSTFSLTFLWLTLLLQMVTLRLHPFRRTYQTEPSLICDFCPSSQRFAYSFRFHLTMDTLAVQLYTSLLPRRIRDFHPLERAHGAQTKKSDCPAAITQRIYFVNSLLTTSTLQQFPIT